MAVPANPTAMALNAVAAAMVELIFFISVLLGDVLQNLFAWTSEA
jgi:hypothetical protein